jgi:hypothetical protein
VFPLVFEADEAGGSCQEGCHDAKNYSREYRKIDVLQDTLPAKE